MRIAIIEDETYWRECTEKIVRKYHEKKELLEIDVYEMERIILIVRNAMIYHLLILKCQE